eukprot:CAMPEP_0178915916 /NCGR_PEP_ID=MMETSP0786-20121207/12314_1 /TAXON_ID=186022 /ORGANISM="Thalassionema frauenfeldii, Strain CCMP 1798" /LENGTH=264 /DNA_ID=CAMNT_0020589123 /DNA_START=131 /DNA_END=925 /DNA_ORIENTATION=-
MSNLKQSTMNRSYLRAEFSTYMSSTKQKYIETIFDVELPEGRCVGVQLNESDEDQILQNWSDPDHWVHTSLHPEEVRFSMQHTIAMRKSFLIGRLAMRASLQDCVHKPCLKDGKGRPILPKGYVGSISHKGSVGVALTRNSDNITVGVDIERHLPKKRSIARKVLTESERNDLGSLGVENISADEEVMLRFSLKEAIYKAVHPIVNHFVGFQEAEVIPFVNGTAVVHWNLKRNTSLDQLGTVTAHWKKMDEYFLTSASCNPNGK